MNKKTATAIAKVKTILGKCSLEPTVEILSHGMVVRDMDVKVEFNRPELVNFENFTDEPVSVTIGDFVKFSPDSVVKETGEKVVFRSGTKKVTMKNHSYLPNVDLEGCDLGGDKYEIGMDDVVRTSHFISTEETRYYLCGMFFDGQRNALVSTNGHGMIVTKSQYSGADVIVPHKAIRIVMALGQVFGDENVSFTVSPNARFVRFEGEFWNLVSKVVDGAFPDYTNITKELSDDMKIVFDLDELKEKVTFFTKMKATGIQFDEGGALYSELEDEMTVEDQITILEKSNEWDSVLVATKYLKKLGDIYKSKSKESNLITMAIKSGGNPVLFKSSLFPNTETVIMPMRRFR